MTSPRTFATKAEAGLWLDLRRADTERGVAIDDRRSRATLDEWWPGYLAAVTARLRPSTVTSYEQAWRLRISPTLGHLEVRHIRPGMIDDWHASLAASGLSATKVRQASGVLKRLLDRAVRDGALPTNPYKSRVEPLPSLPRIERPVVEPADVLELASHMRRADDALLVKVLMYLGLRVGEALALHVDDIDFRAATIVIRRSVGEDGHGNSTASAPKNGRTRTLPLPKQLHKELKAHVSRLSHDGTVPIGTTRLVFPAKSGNYRRYRNVRRDAWDSALRRLNAAREAKVNEASTGSARAKMTADAPPLKFTPHDLRATCASLLIDAGASVRDVADYLGHADITTTLGIYARVRPGRAADLARRMDDVVAASVRRRRLDGPSSLSA